MSGRVCYLARTDRGDRPAALRLVSAGSDQAWADFSSTDAPGVRREIAAAADWLAERAGRGDGPRDEIELLCVDVEGGACAWVTSPSPDAVVLGAALSGDHDEWARGIERAESSVQALAAPVAPAKRRALPGRNGKGGPALSERAQKLAVLMVPDVPARLLVDALDEAGVNVARVASWWQAIALAWDPSGPAGSGDVVRGEHVVASSAPVTAVVLIDPVGKLVWSWSREGELVAGGTLRLAPQASVSAPAAGGAAGSGAAAPAGLRLASPEVSRLTTDWLAWSVQLGEAPRRILCLGPEAEEGGESLDPSALGEALTKAWPGATVDLVVHEDPVGATMARLARAEGESEPREERSTLVDLTRRPGRAHRAMFRWAAVAVLALSAGLIGVGTRALAAGGKAEREAKKATEGSADVVAKAAPPKDEVERSTMEASPRMYLEGKLNTKRLALNPGRGLDPAKPVMQELETLSYVLSGVPGAKIDSLELQPTNAIAFVLVPDTGTFEAIVQSLSDIAGSHVSWTGKFGSDIAGMKRYQFEGKWIDTPPAKSGGSAGGAP